MLIGHSEVGMVFCILHLSNNTMFKVYNLLGEIVYQTDKPEARFLTKQINPGTYIIVDSKGNWNKFIVQ